MRAHVAQQSAPLYERRSLMRAHDKGILNLKDQQSAMLNLDPQNNTFNRRSRQISDKVRSVMIRRIVNNEPNEFKNQLYMSMHNLV